MSEIDFTVENGIGLVTLNRPETLHALTMSMIEAFDAHLRAWAVEEAVRAVVVRANGSKAFCAGGDIVSVWRDGKAAREGHGDGALTRNIFRVEYRLDRLTKRLPKPYIALMDGITMGGGVGISAYGSHAVVTDRTVWAMPETVIAFFPDVGTTWLLPRLPGRVGIWLGLTGARIRAADLLSLRLAQTNVPSPNMPALLETLLSLDWTDEPAAVVIDRALARHSQPTTTPPEVETHRQAIDRCFGLDNVEAIRAALAAERTEWADRQLAALDRASPTSLKVTLRALQKGADLDFESCLRMEYRLSQSVSAHPDFHEGVRAMLVDKDRAPQWQPNTLAAVSDSDVEALFSADVYVDPSFPEVP